MKKAIVLLSLGLVTAANAQLLNLSGDMQAANTQAQTDFEYTLRPPRPNELTFGKTTLSGVFVQIVTSRHPLQLINPVAPPEVGSAEENVARDIVTQRPMGLKLFRVSF